MREQWARRLALATGLVVILLSAAIATRFEAAAGDATAEAVAPAAREGVDPAAVDTGRALFEAEGCSGCHSVAGQGNPRSPLDGVGGRLDAEELLHWTTAAPEVADRMPRRTAMLKQGYAELSEDDLAALIAYLQSI